MRARSWMGALLAVTLLLAACGGGGGGGGATTVAMVDNEFQPADLTFSSGAQIELVNEGQALHNLTVQDAGIDQDVEAGQSSRVTIELEAGEYPMSCKYHAAQGMEGTLTVE